MNSLRAAFVDVRKNRTLYLLAAPILVYYVVFAYIPMAGIVIAFQHFQLGKGFFESPWIGLGNFTDFFGSYYFSRLLVNTILLSLLDMVVNFPLPILLALLLNEINRRSFKRVVQTISYIPYFISLVVICGIVADFTSSTGVISKIVSSLGGPSGNLLGKPAWFRPIFIGTNMWQYTGYNSIIYLAALSAIDPELYEAAQIDGAGRLRQTWSVTLPCLVPTIIVLLILRVGIMFNVGFEKVLLLYSPATYQTADIISTFTYRKGLIDMNFGFSTAVGLFNSVINTALLVLTNALSRKFAQSSLF